MDLNSTQEAPEFRLSDGLRIAFRTTNNQVGDKNKAESTAPHVLFCGGFHSTMRGNKAVAIENMCQELSLSYTRFDYRGHGESEGNPADFNLHDWLADLLCILDELSGPVIIIGSSMGAWLATQAAIRRKDSIVGVLLLAAAPDFIQELIEPRLSKSDLWDLQQGETVPLPNAYDSPYPLTALLIESGTQLSLFKVHASQSKYTPNTLTCPTLLIHGTEDEDVPFELSIRLQATLENSESQLTLLSHADHRLSDRRSLAAIERSLKQLVKRCLA